MRKAITLLLSTTLGALILLTANRLAVSNAEGQSSDARTVLTPIRRVLLPAPWTAFQIPPLYERRKPFLFYGSCSLVPDEEGCFYVVDDVRNGLLQIDHTDRLVRALPDVALQWPVSDIAYSAGYLYCGCANEARIAVVDLAHNRVVNEISIGNAASHLWDASGPQWWQLPVVARLGIDRSGTINAVVRRMSRGRETYEVVRLDIHGKMVPPSRRVERTAAATERVDLGVVDQEGNWVYPFQKVVQLTDASGREKRAYQSQPMKMRLDGRREVYDTLSDAFEGRGGNLRELVGFDAQGTLWGVVGLRDADPNAVILAGNFLVSWKNGVRQVHGRIETPLFPIRAPGARHSVVSPNGQVYFLSCQSKPTSAGDRVQVELVRMH